MRYEIKPILSGAEIRRVTWCRHSARPHELCSDCDRGELHLLSLTDEELEVMLRGLTFAADFQDDYYTLYPSEDYNSGNDCKHARGERILARLRHAHGACKDTKHEIDEYDECSRPSLHT